MAIGQGLDMVIIKMVGAFNNNTNTVWLNETKAEALQDLLPRVRTNQQTCKWKSALLKVSFYEGGHHIQ